jgi:tellurite resistance protein
LGIWILGRIWQGEEGADSPMPALYLPGVGQNCVAASWSFSFGATALPAMAMLSKDSCHR